MHKLKWKTVCNFYLLQTLITLGDKSRNLLATITAGNFRGPYSKYVPLIMRNSKAARTLNVFQMNAELHTCKLVTL